ncbi:acyl-CoA carboxylase epsilon subunit [Streptomyces oceani]|uniref:Acyl-CoA carboxylase subunit epsilon n=1 Tax=Streptomyces oceani TaxID=1075402 RepID=A0A1E7KI91_9ACTN|nr:acyl-CoA carboxylase epsilon subunit [Streptomyces oceani]OEV03659.1 hypothetical protein AN216_10405 [Streptomyces oceani]
MIKVVRGNPTPEELAAALAVVRARAVSPLEGSGGQPPTEWSDPARSVPHRARLPRPGPRAWRTAYWPG